MSRGWGGHRAGPGTETGPTSLSLPSSLRFLSPDGARPNPYPCPDLRPLRALHPLSLAAPSWARRPRVPGIAVRVKAPTRRRRDHGGRTHPPRCRGGSPATAPCRQSREGTGVFSAPRPTLSCHLPDLLSPMVAPVSHQLSGRQMKWMVR